MQHSLHALIPINTLVCVCVCRVGGFQLSGRAALLLGFDLKKKNKTIETLIRTASL